MREKGLFLAGVLLTVYGFLVGPWLDPTIVRQWLNGPLGIGQDFGMLGVFLLLICAGYTVAARLSAGLPVPAVALAAVAVVVLSARGATGWYHDLGIVVSFVPVPVLGLLLWAVRAGRMSGWLAAPFGAGCFAVLVAAENGYRELSGWWYPLTLVYALMIAMPALSRRAPAS